MTKDEAKEQIEEIFDEEVSLNFCHAIKIWEVIFRDYVSEVTFTQLIQLSKIFHTNEICVNAEGDDIDESSGQARIWFEMKSDFIYLDD